MYVHVLRADRAMSDALEQIDEISREIEGLRLENEVFRHYFEAQIREELEGDDLPVRTEKVANKGNS